MEQVDSGGPVASHLALLHRVSNLVSSSVPLEAIMANLAALAAQAASADACQVITIEPSTNEPLLRAAHNTAEEPIRRPSAPASRASVTAVSSGACREHGFEAALSVPLVSAGAAFGAIDIFHRAPRVYAPEEIACLCFLGEQAGAVLARARLIEENARLAADALELRRQLEERKVVERAKGILQQKHRLTEGEAYLRLRNESRRLRRPMRELAEALILAESLSAESAGVALPPGAYNGS